MSDYDQIMMTDFVRKKNSVLMIYCEKMCLFKFSISTIIHLVIRISQKCALIKFQGRF